ncbi:MAG: hypothetical protein IT479_10480 [Xanthomonadales bacterium]|nr:MAG: hypothetical protein EDM74_13305 [Armatimonadota bacterium]MBV6413155.1 hypothetical protein [Xanthomonadales bacterium]MCC6593689.1 hypothetical protein [Xanthomonadales bacterium]MCE7930481.1 hypothetical protein [Xanthomonadales bacterium PRO6]
MNPNPSKLRTRARQWGLLAACALALAACGSRTTRPDVAPTSPRLAPEEAVKQRALKRWDLLIERKFDEAYALLSPGYREVHPQDAYTKSMKDRPVQWTRVLFQGVECESDRCTVEIQVNAQFQMPVMRVGTVDALNVVTESWILSDGEWYLVPSTDR